MWFVSGLVMLYVPFPELKQSEWLAGQQPIAWDRVKVAPPRVTGTVALEMRGAEPVWRVGGEAGPATYLASTGQRAPSPSEAEARRIASLFGHAPVEIAQLIHNDQWTVAGGYDRDRPLWKMSLAGGGGRVLYVSSRTGAVVLDTDRQERFWNWLGSVPHWLYPTVLREMPEAWRQVVLWVSGPCIVGAVAGLWIGLLRIRPGKHRFSRNRMTPYRGWMKWHHIAGLVGGVFLLTWIFSGWLSVDPARYFGRGGVTEEARNAYSGGEPLPAINLDRLAALAPDARRVETVRGAGKPFLRVEAPGSGDRDLDPTTLRPFNADQSMVRERAASLVPDARIASIAVLTQPDAYWYGVGAPVTLPVWRIKFDDRARTWVHVDPVTGELLGSIDARGRAYRWLYEGLHRLDFGILLGHPPARQVVIWVLSIAGLIVSISSVVIGWRRLRREGRGMQRRSVSGAS
jgi:uncharacterized iron-regulated membrane protein